MTGTTIQPMTKRRREGRAFKQLAAVLSLSACAAIVGCTSTSKNPPRKVAAVQTKTKEYFSEKAYGVKASPRVTTRSSRLPRGGGREMVGKPYKVKGRWYYPKEEPGYSKTGQASWYGAAFHGRLTANGEVYDMTHLTAAHPTMPLPSYARVTNLTNGSSVIVRVNDRGPFAHGRVIDLSKRAAEMLDYTKTGVAKVRVDYVGRAPLDGNDDSYLMASYQPGDGGGPSGPFVPQPSSDVMIAMNGATPLDTRSPAAMALAMTAAGAPTLAAPAEPTAFADEPATLVEPILPVSGPILRLRPFGEEGIEVRRPSASVLSYADIRIERANRADDAFAVLVRDIDPQRLRAAARPADSDDETLQVFVGTFGSEPELKAAMAALGTDHRHVIEYGNAGEASLMLVARSAADADVLAKRAWSKGYTDAFRLSTR